MSAMPSVDISQTKEVDPVAKSKMLEAQKMLKAESDTINFDLSNLTDPKKQGGEFKKIMSHYSKPCSMIAFGFICIAIFGIVSPSYGYFVMQSMNNLNKGWLCREKP